MDSIPNRFSSYTFKNGRKSRNRIVIPPMSSKTAEQDGKASQATLENYRRLTESGAGLIMVEYSYVHASGKGNLRQLGVQSDEHIPGLAQIADIIHRSGALAGLQIVHVGGKSTIEIAGDLMSPSGIKVPANGMVVDQPREMSLQDVELWKTWFADASDRAVRAGFDLVELHAAHGYGLNQWLSPLTNRRRDHYGGSLENRYRLVGEIVETIHRAHPQLILSMRFPAQDHLEGGLTSNDGVTMARWLERDGIEVFNVSSGIGGWQRPTSHQGEGYFVDDAAFLRSNLKSPVIAVGKISSGAFIDGLLKAGKADFAAVGRAISENPQTWHNLNLKVADITGVST